MLPTPVEFAPPSPESDAWDLVKCLPATLPAVQHACRQAEQYCLNMYKARPANASFPTIDPPMLAADVSLVLAELMTNIVEHGYGDGVAGSIDLKMKSSARELTIEITDQASPLPRHLLSSQVTDFDENNLDDLPEGGFGWPIVHEIMDHINHRIVDGGNCLTLRKNLAEGFS